MLHKLLYVLVPVMILAACGQFQTPLQYNDKMARISDSLETKGKRWGTLYVKIRPEKKFSELKPLCTDLLEFIDSKIAELKQDKDVHGSLEFRDAMLKYLYFEKQFSRDAFSDIANLSSTSSDEDILAAERKLLGGISKENEELDNVRLAQSRYAADNHLKIKKATH